MWLLSVVVSLAKKPLNDVHLIPKSNSQQKIPLREIFTFNKWHKSWINWNRHGINSGHMIPSLSQREIRGGIFCSVSFFLLLVLFDFNLTWQTPTFISVEFKRRSWECLVFIILCISTIYRTLKNMECTIRQKWFKISMVKQGCGEELLDTHTADTADNPSVQVYARRLIEGSGLYGWCQLVI